jgi:hypothetical protein
MEEEGDETKRLGKIRRERGRGEREQRVES